MRLSLHRAHHAEGLQSAPEMYRKIFLLGREATQCLHSPQVSLKKVLSCEKEI